MKSLRLLVLIFALTGIVVLGCGPASNKTAKRFRVSGQVTLDGKDLKTGKITFEPVGTGDLPADLDILDGRYEGKVALGKNKVQINSFQKISMKEKMKMDGPGYDQMVEVNMLPERYNSKSEITKEVEANNDNKFDFHIKSQ